MKLYGIKNCNSVKKTTDLLDGKKISYEFIDLKKVTPSATEIENWISKKGAEVVINKKGMMWRKLPPNIKEQDLTSEIAISLALETPTMMKRPIIENGDDIIVGFDEVQQKFA